MSNFSSTKDYYEVSRIDQPMTPPEHAKPLGDTAPPTDKLRSDSSTSATPAAVPDHVKPAQVNVTDHGFPNTELDDYISRERNKERIESSPRWNGPSYVTDPAFEALNAPTAVPGKLNESEQKTADRLTSAVEEVCKQEKGNTGSPYTPDADKAAKGQLADVISKIDGRMIPKILPTVNEKLAHSDLNSRAKLATLNQYDYHQVYLGVKTPESGQAYAVDSSAGLAKDSPTFLQLAFPPIYNMLKGH